MGKNELDRSWLVKGCSFEIVIYAKNLSEAVDYFESNFPKLEWTIIKQIKQ
jgi:hypothetical protein